MASMDDELIDMDELTDVDNESNMGNQPFGMDNESNMGNQPSGMDNESKEESCFIEKRILGYQKSFLRLSSSSRSVVNDHKFLEFYRRAADLKRKYKISLEIPEFILVGVQSSGKSSCLAQFLQMSISFIQSGTGTRQPVRYSVRYLEGVDPPRVWINGKQFQVDELPFQLQSLMKPLEKSGLFSDKFIQVEIETDRSPDMVVIDLPGLLVSNSSDEQMGSVRKLVTQFITKKNSSGGFDYIPLIVLKAQDPQTDPTFPLLDELCSESRKHWRDDSVFIINQIDLFNQFVNAEHVIGYFNLIKGLAQDGCVVACSMNPQGKALTTQVDFETDKEIHEYLRSVPQFEVLVLDKIFHKYSQNATPGDRRTLNKYRQQHCGIPMMRYMIQKKIGNIVQKIKPKITRSLEQRRNHLQMELDKVRQTQNIANSNSLLRRISELVEHIFGIKKSFEQREELECAQGAASQLNVLQTWKEEMEEFFKTKLSEDSKAWHNVYYLEPSKLKEVLSNHPNKKHYIDWIEVPLRGTPQLKRAFALWRVMFSRIDFAEQYKDAEFVQQSSVYFDGTTTADLWKTVKNILDFATKPLEHACEWLADYYKWRLKTDFKEIIHHVCHTDACPDFRIFSSDNFTPCIELIELGYGNCIDTLTKDFICNSKYNRDDSIRIIDPNKVDTFTKTAQKLQNEEKDEEKDDGRNDLVRDDKELDDSLFVSMTPLERVQLDSKLGDFPKLVIKTSQKYFLVIRYFVLERMKGKFFHRLVYDTISDYKKLRNACITGALDLSTTTHVDILSRRYQIEPQKLISILELESDIKRSNGFMIDPEKLTEKCGFNEKKLKMDVDEAQEELAKFSKEEIVINNLLRGMDNALTVLDQDI